MLRPSTVWIITNWKILEERGIPDHHTCLLRKLCAGQEETVRNRKWINGLDSKSGKEYVKAVYCHPAYLTSMQSTSCEMPGWMNYKLESRFPGEISQPQIGRWYHPKSRKQRLTKEPLDEGERVEWRSWLKNLHSTTKIMASGPITSWQIDEGKWKQWQTIFLGSKITVNRDCSHEI